MDTYRVWIEEGCLGCHLCSHYCPEVFLLAEEGRVRGEARCDGVTDGNFYRRSPLRPQVAVAALSDIADVVTDCPAQVVRWERVEACVPADCPEGLCATIPA